MTNLLYLCALSDSLETYDDEPRQVLLRIYGPSHSDTDVQLEVFKQLAMENLGPKLYGIFDGGRLEEYLPSNPLLWHEMISEKVFAAVARKIAAIQRMNVKQLNKGPNWLLDKFNLYYDFIVLANKSPPIFSEQTLETTKCIANELRDIDYKSEINYLENLILESNAPLVFSHNDLHQNNIILLHNNNEQNNIQGLDEDLSILTIEDRIVLIDFEYCSYNYRTFDLANHLSEWCFDYNGDKYPYFNYSKERFPADSDQKKFLGYFASQHYGDDTNDCEKLKIIDMLFNEMQPFLMASNLLWTLWAIKSAYTSKINFGYWEMAKGKWEIYLVSKERFLNRI